MIMSLGGSPEPLKKSIELYRPAHIVFFASHDSTMLSGDIIKGLDPRPSVEFEITEDPNSLYESYRAARRGIDRIKRQCIPHEEVMVDYTGGTKVMTAALILATIGQRFQFNYVGGDQRNKNGLGTVQGGHEKMFSEMSPWAIFAEEERRQVVTLFNRRRYSSVISIIDACIERKQCPDQVQSYFQFVRCFADGFHLWEQFSHTTAMRRLEGGKEALSSYFKRYPDPLFESFIYEVNNAVGFLSLLIEKTDSMKKYDMVIVEDLVNNASRRMLDKRYDDAAARIYRALELYGQICFIEVARCGNDSVKTDIVPPSIREEFIKKYQDPKSKVLKLPLTATFRYLQEKGHEAGLRFFQPEIQKKLKDIQFNRNSSILAHGIKPVSEHAMSSIFETIRGFIGVNRVINFPELPV